MRNFSLDVGLKFEIGMLGEKSVHEDACLFQRARVIMGVHGAGLANIIFAKESSILIVIGYTRGMLTPQIYFDEARFLNIKYYSIVADGSYSSSVKVSPYSLQNIFNALRVELQ